MALAGGAQAAQQYLAAGLVDEMELSVVPVLLGGGARLFTLEDQEAGDVATTADELVALDQLVSRLSDAYPRPAKVVLYRIFGGLDDGEIAEVLGVSTPTVRRDWRFARAWLQREIGEP